MKKALLLIIRTSLTLLSIIFFGLFVIPMAGNMINPGNISGALLCIWVFCISVAPLHGFIKNLFGKKFVTRLIYRIVNVCFILFTVYGAVVTGAMIYCAGMAPADNATAVVLGAQVKNSGPSVMLRGRINAADKYLKENLNTYAVLTGGQGADEPMSEAQSMFDSLKNNGINEKRLYKEDKAENTTENLEFSMNIIEKYGLNGNIAVVTDGFHQLRVRIIANQLGIKGSVGAVNSDTSFLYLPTFTVREWFALPYQVLFR